MKKARMTTIALALIIILTAGTALAADTGDPAEIAELLPVDVITHADRLEIRKIYELSPDVDPGRLPRDDFERGDHAYECTDILREVVIGEEVKTVTITETAESRRNDMDTVLALFPQFIEYSDEDGFSGMLMLNTATIKSEISGYGRSSTPYTVSRSYPNLSNADSNHIPKTLDDNGRTLQLQDIQWRTDNTMNVDDYEIGNRYTAVVTYGGTRTSSYVSGYNITANYTGEVVRKGVTVIRYTVIFTGAELPAPAPAPIPEPAPEAEPEPSPEPEPAAKTRGASSWLPTLISLLALAGSGACAYLTLKNRKETPHYEESNTYDYPDPDTDDGGDDAGNGERDV
jgi:hypothetical protein